jgi:hypothetical protein
MSDHLGEFGPSTAARGRASASPNWGEAIWEPGFFALLLV